MNLRNAIIYEDAQNIKKQTAKKPRTPRVEG